MKKSNYNIFIPQKGFVIGYNSFTNKHIGLPRNVYNLLTQEDDLTVFMETYPKHFDGLVEYGFIIDDFVDELSLIRLRNKDEAFASRNLYLMIYPTQDCNLKCWYCYESHVKDSLMTPEVMERVYKLVENKLTSNEFDSLQLGFFGGEPLTNFENIAFPLAKTLKQMVEAKGKKFHSFFVTNGSLITPEMIPLLKEINPYFQITIDGCKEKHNKVRIWKKDNGPTYDTIIDAIKMITTQIYDSKEYSRPIVTLRINYDNQTLKHITDVLDDINEIDRNSLTIHFERVWQTRHLVDDEQYDLFRNVFKQFYMHGFHLHHGCFGIRNVSCPAETNSFIIVNYNGLLYRCNGRTLTPDTKEGELSDDGTITWDTNIKAKRLGLSTFENPKCLNCIMLPQCLGPCSQKLTEHGEVNDEICSLKSLDLPLEEYIAMRFEMKYYNDLNNEENEI